MEKWHTYKILSLVILLGSILSFFAGCQRQEPEDLSFETIAKGEGFSGYSFEEPELLIITKAIEVDEPGLDVQFPPDIAEKLRSLDYREVFAVFVFRGLLTGRSPELSVDILNVNRHGNEVVIKTHFGEPAPDGGVLLGFSSPYYMMSVYKAGKWKRDIRFVLDVDGKEVKEVDHYVP